MGGLRFSPAKVYLNGIRRYLVLSRPSAILSFDEQKNVRISYIMVSMWVNKSDL